jgi:non-homologous end joining protein Ku
MPRELWKGAIRFGLVHIPVSLFPAEQAEELTTLRYAAQLRPAKAKHAPREAEVIDFAKLLERSLAAKTRRKAAGGRAPSHHRRAA